jgi:energy-coupling factor transporter transmembrane protein EcfT
MPRRQKPPGKEKWTWDEIRAGYRFSKSQKRAIRLAVSMGAKKLPDGRVQPPTLQENPGYWLFFGLIALMMIIGLVISMVSAK